MEVFEAVQTALAIRNYKATPVPQEVVRRIVEAGRLTGSAMNTQPWHFIVVDEKDTLNQLGAIARTGPYVAQAPLAIVVAIQKTKFSEYAKSLTCLRSSLSDTRPNRSAKAKSTG